MQNKVMLFLFKQVINKYDVLWSGVDLAGLVSSPF
jgi:hypothetical protein